MTPEQITAARKRCNKAQHLSLRTTQCCDVSIDGAIGSALEFIAHVRADLTLALDDIAAKDAEIAELKSAVSDYYWDQNAVQCGNCSVQILTKGHPFKPGGKVSNGLSDTGSSEDEALCGMCAGEEMYRLGDLQDKSDARIAELERENQNLLGVIESANNSAKRRGNALKVAREAIETLLASAHPHPTEHPTMTAAWKVGSEALAAISSVVNSTV